LPGRLIDNGTGGSLWLSVDRVLEDPDAFDRDPHAVAVVQRELVGRDHAGARQQDRAGRVGELLEQRGGELVEALYLELSFPAGAVLLTGTGVVPPDEFTLRDGDRVRIAIEGVGVLEHAIYRKP
jgi:hypothetical protein